MFKYFREMHELKKQKLTIETALISQLYGFVDGLPDIVALAKRAKELDATELQKLIVEELVSYVKDKENKDEEKK
jgi:hypothetical protein